ncbi:hypothetical protein O0L34_g3508 [Tuta absoluta]|nr:hypothetical protein O0L34_g3508 [Tuta absoluta]
MSIYHWKLGDIALAKISQKFYAKIKVVKDEKGLFYDDKVLGIDPKGESIEVTEELCYFVEILRTGQKLWLPYTCLHLAGRSRPFYGVDRPALQDKTNKIEKPAPKKRKVKEDYTLPLEVKLPKHSEPCLNVTFDQRHTPLKQGRYENAFSEFIRRGKEMLFDHFYSMLERDSELNFDVLDYVRNVDASTEDKFEEVIKNVVSEKEIDHYLHQCWRYNFVNKQKMSSFDKENKENINPSDASSPKSATIIHTSWCLVCGLGAQSGRLRECPACPSCFHLACRKEWLMKIIHRKNPPQKPQKPTTLVKKILSSTRTICAVQRDKENVELCPSCMWGPKIGYDDVVWHKLGTCSWWPARVLTPGAAPSCLLSRSHSRHEWPLRYYGTLNHAWGSSNRMSLFLPVHASRPELCARDPLLQQAVLDACDDYIAVYLA